MNTKGVNLEIREKILALLEKKKAERDLFTIEIERELGLPKAKVIYYLNALAADGKLEKTRIGRQILQWRLRRE